MGRWFDIISAWNFVDSLEIVCLTQRGKNTVQLKK